MGAEDEKKDDFEEEPLRKKEGISTEKKKIIGGIGSFPFPTLGQYEIVSFSKLAHMPSFTEMIKNYKSPSEEFQKILENQSKLLESVRTMPELPEFPTYPELPEIKPDTSRKEMLEYLQQKELANEEYFRSISSYNNQTLENNQKMLGSFYQMVEITRESIKSQRHMLFWTIIMVIIASITLIASIYFSLTKT